MTRSTPARGTDLAIALLIFCTGTWVGVRAVQAFRAAGGAQEFYQSEFGPAVMLACGAGFRNPDTRTAPALAAFLSQQSDRFDCGSLPAAIATNATNSFQRTSSYLELAVAFTWKVVGVSWSRLAVLNGVFFGSVAALTYGVLRLALSRVLALFAIVPAVMSTPNVMLVPQLRDYAKGPFLLAVIFLMGVLVVSAADRRRAFAWSSISGVVVGLGVGFRTDLMIAIFPVMLTIGLLLPPSVSTRTRMAAIALFLVSFIGAASPILKAYAQGGNTGHVALLGLAADFDRTLGVQPSLYEFVGPYNDTLAFSIINGYAVRAGGQHGGVDLSSAEYDRTAMAYLGHIGGTFPADLVTRTLAAIRAVPHYFLDSSLGAPPWIESNVLRTMYWFRGGVSARLAAFAVPAVGAATIAIATTNPRAAWLVVVILLGFAGTSAIQFHERHFYYLQFVPWLAFGVLVQAAMRGRTLLRDLTPLHAKRAAVGCAIVGVAAGGAIVLSRGYQERAAGRLFEQYESAPRTPLSVERRDAGSNRTLFTLDEWMQPLPRDAGRVVTRFLAVELVDAQCGRSTVDLTARYQAVYPDADLSETMTVPLHHDGSRPTMKFFPAYDRADESIRFRGIETTADRAGCVAAVFRVDGLERTPLLLNTTLAADWRQEPLYQRLR